MRTPSAFIPPGLVNPACIVLVTPPALSVIGRVVFCGGAIHVQNNVLHTLRNVLVVTHESVISSLYVGQQVTVVTDATPVESWHALT